MKEILYSPDGARLAVLSSIGICWLYDATTYREVTLLAGHTDSISDIVFSPDGTTLVGVGWRGIQLWDTETGEHKTTLPGYTRWVSSVVFSLDGKTFTSGSSDWTVRLWDVQTGEQKQAFTGHRNTVRSVAFSPDGKTLAQRESGRDSAVVGYRDG